MKRAALFIFVFAISTAVFAAGTTQPVIVATRAHVGKLAVKSLAVGFDPTDPAREYREFSLVNGFAANLTDDEIAAMRKSPDVVSIESDLERHALSLSPAAQATSAAQVTPYGVSLVHAPQAWPAGRGNGINVVIIDTGIDYNHPELSPIYGGGVN